MSGTDTDLIAALEGADEARLAAMTDSLAGQDDPAQLSLRSALLRHRARRLMHVPALLLAEAADSDARAMVQRDIAAAAATLEAAAGMVTLAERAVAETEAPERKAYERAVAAQQLTARAQDALEKGADEDAEPATLIELRRRLSDTAAVEQHKRDRLSAAQQATADARGRLTAARERQREAAGALAAAKAALDAPLRAGLDAGDTAMVMLLSWPARVWFAMTGDLPPLTDQEREVVKSLAALWCDELGAVPPTAAQLVREQVTAEVAHAANQTMIRLPNGTSTSVASLMTASGLPGGPSALGATAMGR